MNDDAANTVETRQKAPRLRGRPRVRGKLAERLGQELQRSRVKQGLDVSAAAELAQTTTKRLGEIEEGAVTATISTIERIAESVKLDWATVFVPFTNADASALSEDEIGGSRGA
jgi:transcriptional regulator with XRE-family HTH domain